MMQFENYSITWKSVMFNLPCNVTQFELNSIDGALGVVAEWSKVLIVHWPLMV